MFSLDRMAHAMMDIPVILDEQFIDIAWTISVIF